MIGLITRRRSMHIRHVVRQYYPAVGGLEESVALLAQNLNATRGVSSSVVTLDRQFGSGRNSKLPARDQQNGVDVRRIPFRGSSRYPLAPQVLHTLADADIVHVHGIDFFFDFLAATKPIHGKLLVASTHGGFFHTSFASGAKKIWFNTVTRVSAKAYSRIFGSSLQDAETFARIAPDRTIAIENGVNTIKWRDAASNVAVPVLIFVGRFSVNKEIPTLIKLIAALGAPWRLIVAGQNSDYTAPELAKIAETNMVSDRVKIVSAPDDAAICGLISQASFVVSASKYEGFGLSVVEGMSAGLTPILNSIPPFQRLIGQSGRGRTVDFQDLAATVQSIHGALDELRADTAHHRALNMSASEVYGWSGATANFLAEYRALIANL